MNLVGLSASMAAQNCLNIVVQQNIKRAVKNENKKKVEPVFQSTLNKEKDKQRKGDSK